MEVDTNCPWLPSASVQELRSCDNPACVLPMATVPPSVLCILHLQSTVQTQIMTQAGVRRRERLRPKEETKLLYCPG